MTVGLLSGGCHFAGPCVSSRDPDTHVGGPDLYLPRPEAVNRQWSPQCVELGSASYLGYR